MQSLGRSEADLLRRQPQAQRALAFRGGPNGRTDADLADLENRRQLVAAFVAVQELAGEPPAELEALGVVGPVALGRPDDLLRRRDIRAPPCAAQGLALDAAGDEVPRRRGIAARGVPDRIDMKGGRERLQL